MVFLFFFLFLLSATPVQYLLVWAVTGYYIILGRIGAYLGTIQCTLLDR